MPTSPSPDALISTLMAYLPETAPLSRPRPAFFFSAAVRVLSILFFVAAFSAGFDSGAPWNFAANAAEGISRLDRESEIRELLLEGRRLEREERWNEALTHYENASRRFPSEGDFEQRFEFARMHFELGRRYADASFKRSLRSMSSAEALDLYTEVLLKIESHYVDEPDWGGIVAHGTEAFELALGRPAFLEAYDLSRADERIPGLRQRLRREVGGRQLTDRRQAREAVRFAATLAEDALGVPFAAAAVEYVCGAISSLDHYSAYLTPGQLDDVYSQIEGNFVGLGIELKVEQGRLKIVRVITDSPAEESGIKAGEFIVAVDGRATERLGTDEAANLLQGPEGSEVQLSLEGSGGAVRAVRAIRRRVDVPSIDEERILDSASGIAYMRLSCFQKTTPRDLDAALWRLHRAGMRKLVLDLRGNPGGLLLTAVEVSDKFLTQGTIVATRGRDRAEAFTYTAKSPGTWHVPLVILVDSQSASASEIFAGAIRDHHRGVIIGERSFGKGSVQGIFPLATSAAGLRLTTAKFYSPAGRPYNRIGVVPDVEIPRAFQSADTARDAEPDADPVVAEAVRVARTLSTQSASAQQNQRLN